MHTYLHGVSRRSEFEETEIRSSNFLRSLHIEFRQNSCHQAELLHEYRGHRRADTARVVRGTSMSLGASVKLRASVKFHDSQ